MAAKPKAPQRNDARRNREAILDAARELFAESSEVPMYEIGRRAGVGQATLYRHFPDRGSVAAAIFAGELDGLERLAAERAADPRAFFAILRAVAEVQGRFHGLIECLGGEGGAAAETAELKARFLVLIEAPLREAKAAGLLRPDFGLDDVFLLIAMVAGALDQAGGEAGAAAGTRALALLFEGIGSPGPAAD